jgi:hypothetical protein
LDLPITRRTGFGVLVILVLWPSSIRSLHWWQSQSVVTELALTTAQVRNIARAYDGGTPERYRFAEATIALFRHMDESKDRTPSDSECLLLTQLSSAAAMAQAAAISRLDEGIRNALQSTQLMRLRQLVASGRIEPE